MTTTETANDPAGPEPDGVRRVETRNTPLMVSMIYPLQPPEGTSVSAALQHLDVAAVVRPHSPR